MTTTHTQRRTPGPLARCLYGILVSSLLLGGAPRVAAAQSDYATLVVVVTQPDSSQPGGQGVRFSPGQEVRIVSEQGAVRGCKTDADGACRFGSLEPGRYLLGVVDGPSPVVLRLRPGQTVTRNILIGDPTKKFENPEAAPTPASPVRAAPVPTPPFGDPLEERIKAGRLGVTSTAGDVEALSNRNQTATPLLDLLPGAFEDADDFVINGSRQNVLRLDGLDTTPLELSSASFQDTGAALAKIKDRQSINSYESFSVDTSNTPAKFGTGTGGQLLQNIKSGKKVFAGKLYEYFAHDAFSARNFFDFAEKPSLRFHLFGLNLSGRLLEREGPSNETDDRRDLFAFFNYEGIRASSGVTLYEAAPGAALAGSAAPAVAPLLSAYRAGGATPVPGASGNADFDILKLDGKNYARRDGVTLRLDYTPRKLDSLNFIYQGAISTEDVPDGVTGRRAVTRNASHTGILNYKRVLTRTRDAGGALEDNAKMTNQLIFGFRNDPVRVSARLPDLGGLNLSALNVGLGEKVPQTGIAGRPAMLGVATPGGLLPGADFGRRGLRFEPYQFSFIDQLTWEGERHHLNFGGEVRLLRNTINNLFGAAYSFGSLDDFLDGRASVDFVGDLGSYTGDVGERRTSQEYYILYGQDGWDVRRDMRLTYGLRYEYYTVLREERDRAVVFDPAGGVVLGAGTPFYRSRRGNLLPRVSFAWAPRCDTLPGDLPESQRPRPSTVGPGREAPKEPCVINANRTVFGASFGVHTGPDALDNILRPVTSDRLRLRQSGLSFPADTNALAAAFHAGPADRRFQPLALARDYTSPHRAYKFDVSLKRALIDRVVTDEDLDDADKHVTQELFVLLSYQGTRTRNLLLRNFANRIVGVETNADQTRPACVRREFDAGTCDGTVQRPFGEIDYLTTGGRADYDSLQVTLTGRARKFLRFFQASYTLARNRGNTDGDATAGAGNPLDYDYDYGYVAGDTRHKLSFGAVFIIPACKDFRLCEGYRDNPVLRELIGGWNLGLIGNFQSGPPLDVRIKRPEVVYVDASGNVFASPDVGRSAVLNVPGGVSGASYRPDFIPGVNPYTGGFADRLYLNPGAFSTPAPGELGNLGRGALRGPGLRVVSLSFRKDINFVGEEKTRTLRFHADVTNVFNFTNFKLGSGTLPDTLGLDAAGSRVQPGQPFSTTAAPDFGILSRTVKSKQDLGSSRQIQFGLAFDF